MIAEGLVIVTSILLAFGIDALWERREARVVEFGYLSALQDEFRGASAELELDSGKRSERIRVIDLLIGQTQVADAPTDSVVAWMDGLWTAIVYLPPDAVYRDLLSTRGLSVLHSHELRRALLDYGQQRDKLLFYESRSQQVWDGSFRPYLEGTIDVLLVNGGRGSVPDSERPTLGAPSHPSGLTEALADRRFQNLLLTTRTLVVDEQRRGAVLAAVVREVLDLLEAELR